MTWQRVGLGLLATAALLYAAVSVVLWVFQRALIYHPQPALVAVPSLRLPVSGAELQISVLKRSGSKALLYFGGNAEDVSGTYADLARWFPDHALYLMHYRGYGSSTGEPTEAALHADAQVLWDLVGRSHTDISVMGRSLGSGVAVRLASGQPSTKRLILVTPYDSITAVAERQLPWLPVRWLLTDTFDSAALAAGLKMPVMVIAAERDAVIGRAHTQALLEKLPRAAVRYVEVPGRGHNDLQLSPAYAAALSATQ